MIPVLEDYGFRFTGNVVPSYAGDFSERMSHADILAGIKKGWEIWGHGWKHENLDSVTEPERVRALTAARDYWARRGVPTAAALMAYPFGDYNVDVIQSARDLGYRLARITSRGLTLNPVAPACSPYALPAYSPEGKTKHQVLSMINRCRKAGTAIMTYTHNCDAGGADTESAPSGGVSFYEDHFGAWCETVQIVNNATRLPEAEATAMASELLRTHHGIHLLHEMFRTRSPRRLQRTRSLGSAACARPTPTFRASTPFLTCFDQAVNKGMA